MKATKKSLKNSRCTSFDSVPMANTTLAIPSVIQEILDALKGQGICSSRSDEIRNSVDEYLRLYHKTLEDIKWFEQMFNLSHYRKDENKTRIITTNFRKSILNFITKLTSRKSKKRLAFSRSELVRQSLFYAIPLLREKVERELYFRNEKEETENPTSNNRIEQKDKEKMDDDVFIEENYVKKVEISDPTSQLPLITESIIEIPFDGKIERYHLVKRDR